ncbi:MAG: tyrosine-type recombinase/integrase [Acidobacteriota bacterium]
MRRGYQKGSLKIHRENWVAQWWDNGHRKNRVLGPVSKMTKSRARSELAAIVLAVNNRSPVSTVSEFQEFVHQIFLPFYRRKWKRSTRMTNEDRFRNHLYPHFAGRDLGSINRDQLQNFLDGKAAQGLSFSVVAHLRWDLKQIFNMAVSEGVVSRNPASLLFVPKRLKQPAGKVMTFNEVRKAFSVLDQRERLIVKIAILSGMRPGEIFALTWGRLQGDYAEIRQGIYKGHLDTPKTSKSVREVALSQGLLAEIEAWRRVSVDTRPQAWVFPSETMRTAVAKDNCWRRHIAPRFNEAGLEWVNFQVMRRTHSSLMNYLKRDPKVVADQLGHTLDVNQNVYTQAPMELKVEAVNELEAALVSQ